MNLKKILAVFLAALTACILCAVCAGAETYGDYGYTVLDDGTVEITGYAGSATTLEIPSKIDGKTVTSIGDYAFFGCDSLTSVTIPDSVTSIGDYAFAYCTSLTSITVDENNTEYSSVDGVLFNKDKTTLICYPAGKTATAYIIPDSVTSIGVSAFYSCYSLTSVTIPDSVTSIGDGAFAYCTSLTSVTIPDSVTSIGDWAFAYCSSLTSVTIPDSVTSIGNFAFEDCDSLTSVTIPDSVTSIGEWVFAYSASLTSVTIPDSVTSIGDGAFAYCTSLTSVTIPDSVTSIGERAFYRCTSLTSVTIPDSVTSIGYWAFAYCSEDLVIYCYENSAAHTYAVDNVISYELLKKLANIENFAATGYGLSAKLTWSKNTSGTGYVLQQYKNNAWTTIKTITSNATTSYSVTGLKANTSYKFRIAAYNATTGKTGAYTQVSVTTTPTNVTGVKATGYGLSAKLTWNKNTTATKYIIQQYKNNAWTTIKTITSNATTSYSVTGLKANTSYKFRIAPYNATTGKTGAYTQVSVTTTPTNVTGVKATGYGLSAKLTWNKNTTATKYIIQQYKNGAWTTIKTITSNATTSYSVTGLKANTSYKFRIAPYNATTGKTGAYTQVSVTTTPTNVTGVKATGYGLSAKLSWNKNTTATKYIIQQYKSGAWTTIKTITSNATTSYSVTGLKANTSYKFRIAPYNATTGKTGAYTQVSVTTTPTNVTGVKATSYKTSVKLSWTKNTTATKYIVQQYKNGAWSTVKTITSNSTVSTTVTGLKANTSYKFRIAPYNATTGKTGAYTTVTAKTKS